MTSFEVFVIAWVGVALLAVGYLASGPFGHFGRRRRARFDRVLDDLAVLLFEHDDEASLAAARIAHAPPKLLIEAVQSLALQLSGQPVDRMRRLFRSSGLERRVMRLAIDRRWRRRVQAAQLHYLVRHPEFDRRALLHDPHPLVRLRACESLTTDQTADHLADLMMRLDDVEHPVRESAQRVLLAAGPVAVPAVAEALSAGGERGRSALVVAAHLSDTTLLPMLSEYVDHEDPFVRGLVATAFGSSPPADAVGPLRLLLVDRDASVREAALGALARLGAHDVVPDVMARLADPEWAVRRAAAQVLTELGPAGMLALRLQLRHEDRYARDMARQTLDAAAAHGAAGIVPGPVGHVELEEFRQLESVVAGARS